MQSEDTSGESGLFEKYFLPLYPEDARANLTRARTLDANPAGNPGVLVHLGEAADIFVKMAAQILPGTLLDFTDASVHRLGAALTPERVRAWGSRGGAGTPESELFNVVVHGAAYVGACIVRSHGGVWQVRRPLWESLVRVESKLGIADLSIFQWWLKSLPTSSGEAATGLADRYRSYVEVPFANLDGLRVIAPPDRAIPKLTSGKYDILFKYLKAHLPEMKDLGGDFPSPERYAAYKFKKVEFLLAGGGRMLVMACTALDGLHLFWLDADGFQKGAYIEGAHFPEPIVKLEGENVVALVSDGEAVHVHNFPWWGP